jgi:hypothetical protein
MTWTCNCGYQNEYAPDKRKLKCKLCEAVYWVRGLHVNGSPMLALIHPSKGGENKMKSNANLLSEPGTHKPLVVGSNPSAASCFCACFPPPTTSLQNFA